MAKQQRKPKDIAGIGDLTPDPHNARRHDPRNIGAIADSLGRVGFARSIVIDEDGIVLAGNGTIEAAGQAGMGRVQVVEADGETIIAVRRSGLTPKQKALLAVGDNRAAELAPGWNEDVLLDLKERLDIDPAELEFSEEEWGKIEEAAVGGDDAAEAQPPAEFSSFDETLATEYRCPKCSYEWSGKPK